MDKTLKKWVEILFISLTTVFWACSTPTVPMTPDEEDNVIINPSANKDSTEEIHKVEEDSSRADVIDSSTVDIDSTNTDVSSDSTELGTDSTDTNIDTDNADTDKNSTETETIKDSTNAETPVDTNHVIPDGSNESNTKPLEKEDRETIMDPVKTDEIPDTADTENVQKSETLIFADNDMDFNKNDYYCYDAADNSWYKISDSKWKTLWAGIVDFFSKLLTGQRYYDYSKICDEIYIRKRSS